MGRDKVPVKILLLALIAVVTIGCEADPIRPASSTNPNVQVNVLTEFDGIRLYRIQDGDGRPIYVAVAMSELRVEWEEHQGRTTVKRETITVMPK
jgi:hypothetical protein